MALNKRRLDRSKQRSGNKGGGGFHKLVDGKNYIRIFSFNHTVTKADFIAGNYKKGDVEVGDNFDEVERESEIHFTDDGSVNCIGYGCERCAEAQELMASKKKSDQKLGKQLSSTRRFYVNLVDIDEKEPKVKLCGLPQMVFSEILNYILDPDFGEEILGCKGRDFTIERDSKASKPSDMYSVRLRDEKHCEDLPEELQDDVQDLFACKMLEPGWSSNADLNEIPEDSKDKADEEEEPKEKKTSSRRPKKEEKSKKSEEEENDFKDDDEGNEKAPWDKKNEDDKKGPEFDLTDDVSFEDGGETLTGVIVEINEEAEIAGVDVKGDGIYDIPFDELTKVKKKRSARKR